MTILAISASIVMLSIGELMPKIALQVEMIVDIPRSSITASVQKVTDSAGQDRTADFKSFTSTNQLPISTQSEIEEAALEYAKQKEASLP